MNTTTLFTRLPLPNAALAFDLDALYTCFQRIPDHRGRQGRQYALADMLMLGVLAKLAGADGCRAMAHWASLRTQELSQLFHWKRARMPHYSTWSRVLAQAVDPMEVERIVGGFFTAASAKATRQRASLHVALDGKTLRGTIPLGQSAGVHLLAVYQPEQGVVLTQMNVQGKGHELTYAPTVLRHLDLRGVVVSGDAMFAQRNLSLQIVQAQGDYVWIVKDNQEGLREEIEVLFEEPHPPRPGTSALPTDFRTACTVEKGHGRLEKRTLTVSSLLASYSTWPELAQVFKLESQRTDGLGRTEVKIRYGVTSLPTHLADAKRLLELVREHWQIENGLHYRRDVTLREDYGQVRMGHAPEMVAVLNNVVLGVLAHCGVTNVAHARRDFAYQFEKSLTALAA